MLCGTPSHNGDAAMIETGINSLCVCVCLNDSLNIEHMLLPSSDTHSTPGSICSAMYQIKDH